MNLTDDVKKTEFPNMRLQSPNGKKVIMTFKNGQNVLIGTEKTDGTYDSEMYEFSDIQDNVTFPNSPDFPEFLARLKLDQFNGVANSDSRDDYNNNVKHIENTVNGLVDYSLNQKGYFDKLKSSFGDFKGLIMKHIALITAKYLHDNVETKYYKKEDVDQMLMKINTKIDNIQQNLHVNQNLNGIYPPSYSGPLPTTSSDDKILDPAVRAKLERMKNQEVNNG